MDNYKTTLDKEYTSNFKVQVNDTWITVVVNEGTTMSGTVVLEPVVRSTGKGYYFTLAAERANVKLETVKVDAKKSVNNSIKELIPLGL